MKQDISKKQINEDKILRPSSLAHWIKEYEYLCPYARMRAFAVKMFSPQEVIETATLAHRQLYRFRFHRAKIRLIMQDDFRHYKFEPLKEFLELVTSECPHQYFQEGLRASEAPLRFSKKEMIVRAKQNYATSIAKFVLGAVKEPKKRHEALQKFMLFNDSVTVATEVPVYLKREDLSHMQTQLGFELYHKNTKTPKTQKTLKTQKHKNGGMELMGIEELPRLITGHIDFIQVRNGLIHLLDYKDKAARTKPIEQLTLYALALSRLTGLRVFHFKCAWFDEKDYFEFFPLHAVYKPKKKRRSKKISCLEGIYKLNEKLEKIENLRPMV